MMSHTENIPTVSVIIPSYNHEKYVGDCIRSVLNQTYGDFEIVITDDGSSDQTVSVIKEFKDPRIKLFTHAKNEGACIAANNCLTHARGKYIAMLSSDDVWYPHKLETQVNYLDEHPEIGVVFGKVDWIDENSDPITNKLLPFYSLFDVGNRSRFEWLRYFFMVGNCLCHPCSLVRKECYAEAGMFNPRYASLPDLDFWIRICLKYEIHILDQKLIRFRKFSTESSASGTTLRTLIRNRFEHRHSLDHYLTINHAEDLLRIFPNAEKYGKVLPETISYILGRIAIDTDEDYKVLWGLDVIYAILQDSAKVKILESQYNFTYLTFIKLTAQCDIYKLSTLSTNVSTIQKSPIRMVMKATRQYIKDIYLIMLQLLNGTR